MTTVLDKMLKENGLIKPKDDFKQLMKEGIALQIIDEIGRDKMLKLMLGEAGMADLAAKVGERASGAAANVGSAVKQMYNDPGAAGTILGRRAVGAARRAGSAANEIKAILGTMPSWQVAGLGVGALIAAGTTVAGAVALARRLKATKTKEQAAQVAGTIKAKAAAAKK
jgi:hypothetical protein